MSKNNIIFDDNPGVTRKGVGFTKNPNHVIENVTEVEVAAITQMHQLILIWWITFNIFF